MESASAIRFGYADHPCLFGMSRRFEADALRIRCGNRLRLAGLGGSGELHLARPGFGCSDVRIPLGLGERHLLVSLRISRLADFHVEPLLGTLGLQLGDLGFFDYDPLPIGRLRERTGLLSQRSRLIDLRLVSGLLDLGVAASLGLERLGLLLFLGRFPISACLRDASLPLDGDGVRSRHVLDVTGRIVDLLDLKRIDDQAQLLHFGPGVLAGELREFLAVANHFLNGHVADDCPQVAGEHVVHPLVHLVLLIEESPCGVGDGCVIIANLVDDNRSDLERDALLAHTVDLQVGLAQVER
jgi:hypothetical protein